MPGLDAAAGFQGFDASLVDGFSFDLEVLWLAQRWGLEIEEIMSGWEALTELRAVRDGRVRVLEGDLMVVPGPRLPELVARIAWALHPDREWEIR